MPTPDTPSLDRFFHYAARQGFYPTAARLEYYCRGFFRGVPLVGKSVLDIGCGRGLLLAYARLAGAQACVGLEPEAGGSTGGALRDLRRLLGDLGVAGVEARAERLEDFARGGRRFDVVVLCNAVNHLDQDACDRLRFDPQARRRYVEFFSRIGESMTPGGTFIITDCGRFNLFAPLVRIGIPHPFERSIDWTKHQEPGLWLRLLEQAGFSESRVSWRVPNRLRRFDGLLANGVAGRCLLSDFRIVTRWRGMSGAPTPALAK